MPGNVNIIECSSFEEAKERANSECSNAAGIQVPVTVFQQGSRMNLTGALPFKFVTRYLDTTRSARRGDSITQLRDAINRPEIPEHTEVIAEYLAKNGKGKYIMPPVTLNVREQLNVYTMASPSTTRLGYLVIPFTANMSPTDGQHRIKALSVAMGRMDEETRVQFEKDGVAVMITCESEITQIHQDFADCSKTKPLPPSLLTVFDRRNRANGIVLDLIDRCPVFTNKIDSTSTGKLSKNSPMLFLTNQVRQMTKALMFGAWAMADEAFNESANKVLETDAAYSEALDKYVNFINYITELIPAWKVVSGINPGIQQGRIAQIRDEGLVCLTATGLNIIRTIGHELFSNNVEEWRTYADRLASLNWSKTGEIWQDNIISRVVDKAGNEELDKKGRPQTRILTAQQPVKTAILKVQQAINWHRPTVSEAAIISKDGEILEPKNFEALE